MMKLQISGRPHRQALGQRGMTLIELMVAMTIGLFLMLVLSAAYFNATQLFRTQNQLAELQDNGRSAIEVLTKELRMVGYLGCVNEASLVARPFESIQGFDSVTAAAYVAAFGAAPAGAFAVVPAAPVLVIRHGSYQSIPVTGVTPANITAGPDTFGWDGGAPQMLISDCMQARQFVPTAIAGGRVNTIIATAAGAGFTETARVRTVETSLFFLATPNGHSQPSLYQHFSNGDVNQYLRVADNVANWHLSYATVANVANDSTVDTTDQAAQTVTDSAGGWASVKSLRVDLLLMGSKPVLSDPASYWFNFAAATPADRFLRKEMASTLALRNRIQVVQ